MARKANKKGRSAGYLGSFSAIEHYLQDSPAWLSLGPASRSVYLLLARLYNGVNNGRIPLSGRMVVARLEVSRQTATRCLKELCEKGFLRTMKPSGFNMKTREGRAPEYRMTAFRCDVTGEPPTREFMKWGQHPKQRPHHKATLASPESHVLSDQE